MRDLWNFNSYRRMEVSPTHSELCLFVSGSQAKHQVTYPMTYIFKILVYFGHHDNVLARCDSIFPLLMCQRFWKKLTHNFLFPKSSLRRTANFEIFKDSAIILDAIRRSFLTKSATAAMFISVRINFGRPPLSSFSTSSIPSRNQEYQINTFDRFEDSIS